MIKKIPSSWLRKFVIAGLLTTVIPLSLGAFYVYSLNNYEINQRGSIFHLDEYVVDREILINGIGDELSGLCFSSYTQSLFAVTDSPAQIVELSLSGELLRIIALDDFSDTEAITHLRENFFAVTQESKRMVTILRIDSHTTMITKSDIVNEISLTGIEYQDFRKGPEGIAWSPKLGLLIANEQNPMIISNITLDDDFFGGKHTQNFISTLPLKDMAGLHIPLFRPEFKPGSAPTDSATDPAVEERLIVLSDESRRILEIDVEGQIFSQLKLTRGFLHLDYIMEQPEGVTMDDTGNLYVVGEPHILLVLKRR